MIKEEAEEAAASKESAVSSGLADSLAAILTLTVRDDHKIHLRPEQVSLPSFAKQTNREDQDQFPLSLSHPSAEVFACAKDFLYSRSHLQANLVYVLCSF